ncbi:MAG TPA: ATP-binding protein [Caulobacteraceae bacterium]|jgi:signal transduction histidine kinase/CheY-like chemotaxis protein
MDAFRQIRAARVRSIFERLPGTSLITVINGALIVAVLKHGDASLGPSLWLGLVVILAAGRAGSWRVYLSDGRSSDRLRQWEAVALIGSLLSGVLWGVGAVWLFPADQSGQWLWIFLIGGMCAGAAALHAAHAPTALAFIVPAGAPLAVRLALQGSGQSLAAAAMIVVFLAAMSFTTFRFSRQFGEMLTLQLDLERRTTELDEVNLRLRAEIEHHRTTEETLRQAQKMEALGHLTGGIAHDFNNLLTVISGNLDLIRRRAADNETILRLAAAASHAAKRGAGLTGSLLSFARKQSLHPEPIDLNALILEFAPLLRRAVGESVRLELDLTSEASAAYADAAHFQSAVLNLVINARDAMAGGGTVTISTRSAELGGSEGVLDSDTHQGRAVVVCVRDTGVGMPADVMAKAFEPFFTTKDVGKGSGLGLSQVYGFARQSGGYATIDSAPGEGTSVCIVLPALASGAPGQLRSAPAPMAATTERSLRVLLVEDDNDVLATIREQLAVSGWEVVAAQEAKTALALLESEADFAVLVTDVMLPGGVSGAELARLATTARPGLPVLLISGYPGTALAAQGAVDGEFEVLHKPFTHPQLVERILAATAGRQATAPAPQAGG